MSNDIYDLIIVGGGPAAVSAAIYAARKQLKTLLITEHFDSQSAVSPEIKNWIGEVAISGNDLMKKWETHLREYEGEWLTIKSGMRGNKVFKAGDNFNVVTDKEETFSGKTVLISTGAHRRKLEIPGAKEFEQKGITYCASCDGPLFKNKDVVVIGGGNAGWEAAAQLMAYTNRVLLMDRSDEFRAEKITVKKTLANNKVTALTNTSPVEIKGDKVVQSLIYKNLKTNEVKEVKVQGVFVEIGFIPNTELVDGFLELDKNKAIVVDPQNQQTSVKGVWAAGDCASSLYHQNNIAAGEGVTALEDIYVYLSRK